jgi:hypothetical protein
VILPTSEGAYWAAKKGRVEVLKWLQDQGVSETSACARVLPSSEGADLAAGRSQQ